MPENNKTTNSSVKSKNGTDSKKGKKPRKKTKFEKFLLSKTCGLIITLIQLIITVIFLSYILVLDILPAKYFIPFAIALFLLFIAPFAAQMFKKIRNPFKIVSIVLSIIILYLQITYLLPLGSLFNKVTNSDTITNAMNVYVLKDDSAKALSDMKDYNFGYLTDSANSTLSKDTITDIGKKIDTTLKTTEYDSYEKLVTALFNKEVNSIILNEAYISIITDAETVEDMDETMKNNFLNFETLTKIITTITYTDTVDTKADKNVTKDPFCVYLSGIDVYGKISKTSRSDVNILAFVNPNTKQVLLLNTPRDSYVQNPHSGDMKDKLTHAAIYGIDSSMAALKNIYGIDVDYFFRVNFSGFEKIIDALGGITVYSDYAFTAKHGGYTYVKGNNKLNGKQALSFCRERYAFSAGDRQRGKNQMAVITALINELASSKLLTNYGSIMKNIEGTFETSLSSDQISDLIKMQLNDMASWNVKNYSVDGTGSMEYTYTSPNGKRYVMFLDETTIEKAKILINQVYNGETINLDAVK